MQIKHTTHHRWFKEISDDPLASFGKSNRSRLRSTLTRMTECNISHTIEPLSEEFFEWFLPKYNKTISIKKNAKIFDIKSSTLYKEENIRPYFGLTLLENDCPIGGTIFSLFDDRISIAYRIYDHDWVHASLPANPSIYTEYLISKHAIDSGRNLLSHGLDRNPYGLNSRIGLGLFKLAVGCYPLLPVKPEMTETNVEEITEDALFMLPPESGEIITEALLVADDEENPAYRALFKYTDRLKVTFQKR